MFKNNHLNTMSISFSDQEILENAWRETSRHISDALFELSQILESKYWNVNSMSEGFEYLVRAAEV